MSRTGEDSCDEATLVAQARRGDKQAFAKLVDQHAVRLHGFILRLCGDADMAMDLTQETVLNAWRGMPRFDGKCRFYTWIYRIGRNTVISAARARAVRPTVEMSLGPESADMAGASDAADPAAGLERQEDVDRVVGALRNLPLDLREILILRDIEDRSYEAIAELLQIPAGTVRSRLFRAREQLREILGGARP